MMLIKVNGFCFCTFQLPAFITKLNVDPFVALLCKFVAFTSMEPQHTGICNLTHFLRVRCMHFSITKHLIVVVHN